MYSAFPSLLLTACLTFCIFLVTLLKALPAVLQYSTSHYVSQLSHFCVCDGWNLEKFQYKSTPSTKKMPSLGQWISQHCTKSSCPFPSDALKIFPPTSDTPVTDFLSDLHLWHISQCLPSISNPASFSSKLKNVLMFIRHSLNKRF